MSDTERLEKRIEELEAKLAKLEKGNEPEPPPAELMGKNWSDMTIDEKALYTEAKYGSGKSAA